MQGANLLIGGDTVLPCVSALQYFSAQFFSHTHEKAIRISSELRTLLKNMQLKLGIEKHRPCDLEDDSLKLLSHRIIFNHIHRAVFRYQLCHLMLHSNISSEESHLLSFHTMQPFGRS